MTVYLTRTPMSGAVTIPLTSGLPFLGLPRCRADGLANPSPFLSSNEVFFGNEDKVVDLVLKNLGSSVERHWRDGMGNLFVKVRTGGGPRVMLVAHMDEVSMIVKHVDEDGFLYIAPLGWLDARVLLGQRVVVHGKSPIEGCIGAKPPHITTQEEQKVAPTFKDLYVDVGAASRSEAEALGIVNGTYVTFPAHFSRVVGSRVLGKSFDDRAGCAAEVAVSKLIHEAGAECELYSVFTVQEELGLRGAATIVEQVEPDIAFVFECTVAADTPGNPPSEHVTRIGRGAAIRVMDSSMLTRRDVVDYLVRQAEANGIPYQLQVMTGSITDAGGYTCRAEASRLELYQLPAGTSTHLTSS
jgi:tetrahedral aminopeptidase